MWSFGLFILQILGCLHFKKIFVFHFIEIKSKFYWLIVHYKLCWWNGNRCIFSRKSYIFYMHDLKALSHNPINCLGFSLNSIITFLVTLVTFASLSASTSSYMTWQNYYYVIVYNTNICVYLVSFSVFLCSALEDSIDYRWKLNREKKLSLYR